MGLKEFVSSLIEADAKAAVFMKPTEQMALDNYMRMFNQEMGRLGEGHDDEAMKRAKEQEPKGFNAMMKQADMQELFEKSEL
jgi:hypothetical protein